ncbi:uncharacterized protein B0H64DRAFT_436287 [Chaetomium fimeti]|uniref:Uncharacterized protein n=1 Tax=Chaetomium fimeti TaxID=1854472 RepID=A0AAE0H6I3_9PEZI|nr:hypothetical protein B0H64DRAFT_436287 [Chaetomium fimeti]
MSRPQSAGSDRSTKSNVSNGSAKSNLSNGSAKSTISDDSYLNSLREGMDDQFKQMIQETIRFDDNRSLAMERKIQSHNAKKRRPDDTKERDWPLPMVDEYKNYKAKVVALKKAKLGQKESTARAKQARYHPEMKKEARLLALRDDEKWFKAAIDAAMARFGFMKKYPDAFNTKSNKNHLIAATDNLNSARRAVEEIIEQKRRLTGFDEQAAS